MKVRFISHIKLGPIYTKKPWFGAQRNRVLWLEDRYGSKAKTNQNSKHSIFFGLQPNVFGYKQAFDSKSFEKNILHYLHEI